ncbi:HXXXD-type acyl-transferase family protein [Abeliophyllum distichum]|uniref:HXXXD-type acyl-transferase family protein n=1 Tax=Abeliophyllum distichum TaxID=126358 RepID=A0ABD1Q7J0_9LAMI
MSIGSIVSIQTVVPIRPTDPIINSCRISVPPQNLDPNILGRQFHLIICYNKASDEDSGWLMAGWIKESLSIALCELPMLAGRLRPCESQDSDRDLQIVLNDSGVRLVEAITEMKLADFLDLEGKKEAEGEVEVVFWEDVLEHNLQFSPLFYVQVTNFSCGGYSIGISCSLLLADPFALTGFLKRWINIHNTLVSLTNASKPICYLPKLRKLGSSKAFLSGINTNTYAAQSVIFKIPTTILNLDKNVYKNLAGLCIDVAERKIGRKMGSRFSLSVKKSHEVLKVEKCSTECLNEKTFCTVNGLTCTGWDDVLGADETWFNEENKPAYVSCWMNSISDEGSVMIIVAGDVETSAMQIIVTFPN